MTRNRDCPFNSRGQYQYKCDSQCALYEMERGCVIVQIAKRLDLVLSETLKNILNEE